MVGLTGVSGAAAQYPVVLEYSIDIGLVPIRLQRLVEHSVLGIIAKVTTAFAKLAQVIKTHYLIHIFITNKDSK